MRPSLLALAVVTSLVTGGSISTKASELAGDPAWAGEARYWADREAGDDRDYLSLFDEHFVGWPCSSAEPLRKSDLKPAMRIEPGAVIDRKHSTAGAGFVITYYRATMRVAPRDGDPRTVVADFTHTWIPTAGGWRIAGGMCRPELAGAP